MRALARFALRLKDRRVQQMLCSSSVWDHSTKELAKSQKLTRYFSSGTANKPAAPDFLSRTGNEPPAPDFLCSKRAKDFICRLEVRTDDFSDGEGCSQQLKSLIDASLEETRKKYKEKDLQSLYRSVRPELVSRLLIHSHKMDDSSTHWLANQTHGHMKNKPRFISSYDLMVHLVGLLEEHWVFFLDYLCDERIAVVEEWIQISTVQQLMYDHGLKDFGSGIHFYKGECDASYFQPQGESGTSAKVLDNSQDKKPEGKANLATLIWDDDQVISSLTYRGVGSSSTQEAEAKAAFALLNRAKELKIEHFVLWTDSRPVWGVLSGTRPIEKGDANEDLFRALQSMRTSFKILVPIHMPREVMAFSDGMLRKTVLKYPRFQKKSAQQWAYYLNALPIFKLALTPDGQKKLNAAKQKPPHGELRARVYYVEVAPDRKISSLLNLTRALNASRVYLIVHDYKSKTDETRKDLEEVMGNSLLTHHGDWNILCTDPQSSEKKGGVVIVYDGMCPNNLLNHQVDMVIILSSENDKQALSRIGAQELSASAWIHFKGVLPPGRPAP